VDSDVVRTENLEVVEKQNVALEDNMLDHADGQYDVNIESKEYTEGMITEISKNNFHNDIPRQDMELFVEHQTVENSVHTTFLGETQTDVVMDADEEIESIEMAIDENNKDRDTKREGYEVVVEEVTEDISEYNSDLNAENVDNGFDAKDYTEEMISDVNQNNKESNDNADKNADLADDQIENHVEHLDDFNKHNDESMNDNMDYVETLKDIDVNKITPEMENKLGQKFPEGVTEESFAINDSNGLLKAYIVRRIVVKNGNGKVYEMTQSRYGSMTYTRNGQPITEFQWSNETSSIGSGN